MSTTFSIIMCVLCGFNAIVSTISLIISLKNKRK